MRPRCPVASIGHTASYDAPSLPGGFDGVGGPPRRLATRTQNVWLTKYTPPQSAACSQASLFQPYFVPWKTATKRPIAIPTKRPRRKAVRMVPKSLHQHPTTEVQRVTAGPRRYSRWRTLSSVRHSSIASRLSFEGVCPRGASGSHRCGDRKTHSRLCAQLCQVGHRRPDPTSRSRGDGRKRGTTPFAVGAKNETLRAAETDAHGRRIAPLIRGNPCGT
jgi:hypothetical protein